MKISRILPESSRLKLAQQESNRAREKAQLESSRIKEAVLFEPDAEEVESKMETFENLKSPLQDSIVDKVSISGQRPQAFEQKTTEEVVKKSSAYKNPIQKVKADKIEEMTNRFFLKQTKAAPEIESVPTESQSLQEM